MKLVWSSASPFARKVLVVAHELGIADRIETVTGTGTPMAPAEATKAGNPLAKLPSLTRDDGPPIYDSAVIVQYLTSLIADQTVLPAAGPDRWQALTLEALGDGICESAISVRYELALRDEAQQSADWMAAQMSKVDGALDALDGDMLPSGDFSVGHAAVGCALGYLDLRFADKDWRSGRTALTAWYDGFLERASAKATEPSA